MNNSAYFLGFRALGLAGAALVYAAFSPAVLFGQDALPPPEAEQRSPAELANQAGKKVAEVPKVGPPEAWASPRRELNPESVVTVRFQSPMVLADQVGMEAAEPPVEIRPGWAGRFVWESQNDLMFEPSEPPAFGGEYELYLREGATDLVGAEISRSRSLDRNPPLDYISKFQAEPLAGSFWSPNSWSTRQAPREYEFVVQFPGKVDPAVSAGHIYFAAKTMREPAEVRRALWGDLPDNGVLDLPWDERLRIAAEARRGGADGGGAEGEAIPEVAADHDPTGEIPNALVVRTTGPLAPGTWELVIEKGMPVGDAAMAENQVRALGEIKPMEVSSIEAIALLDRPKEVSVRFSKAIQEGAAEKIAQWLYVSPKVENLVAEVQPNRREVKLTGDFRQVTAYDVTVKAGVPSDDWLISAAPRTEVVRFAPCDAGLALPGTDSARRAGASNPFKLVASNIDDLNVKVKQLDGDLLLYALRGYGRYQTRDAHSRWDRGKRVWISRPGTGLPYELVPGPTIYELASKSTAAPDSSDVIALPEDEIMGGKRFGAYFVSAEGTARAGNSVSGRLGAQEIIQVTDIGLAWKAGAGEAVVYAFSLTTGKPLPGATLGVYDENAKRLHEAATDAAGTARIGLPGESRWLVAQLGADRHAIGFAPDQVRDLSLWRFGVDYYDYDWDGGGTAEMRSLMLSDRPVYLPGETAHVFGLLRSTDGNQLRLPEATKLRFVLRDPRWREVATLPVEVSADGSVAADLKLPPSPLGGYSVQLESEDGEQSYAYHHFRVEEYRPNTFELSLAAPGSQVASGGRAEFALSAKYLMGKALSKAKGGWNAYVNDAGYERGEAFSDYTFGGALPEDGWRRRQRRDGVNLSSRGEMELDAAGRSVIAVDLPQVETAPGPLRVYVSAEVTDVNGQTIAKSASAVVHRSAFYLGVKSDTRAQAGKETTAEAVAVSSGGDGHYSGDVSARVTLRRRDWKSVRVLSAGGGSSVRNYATMAEIASWEAKIPAGGAAPISFTPETGGDYWLSVETQDPSGTAVATHRQISVASSDASPDAPQPYFDGERIALTPDQERYQPGATARIVVGAPFEGQAMVTVERKGVLRHFTAELRGEAPAIEVPLEAGDAPNVFVSAVLVRGVAESPEGADGAAFRLGYCRLEVEPTGKKLDVALQPSAPEVLPGAPIQVTAKVTAPDGAPAAGAELVVWAADEGVLSLTGYELPDPLARFYQPYSLSIAAGHSLDHMIGESRDEFRFGNKGFIIGDEFGEKGGDEGPPVQIRKDFRGTAFWAAQVKTGPGGVAEFSFPAPESLTRFRLFAVAAQHADRFGTAESSFEIKKPLMVEPAAPRFAHVGDIIDVKAVVHNTTAVGGEFDVALKLGGGTAEFASDGGGAARIRVAAGATESVVFPVRFVAIGEAQWDFTAMSAKLDDAAAAPLSDGMQAKFEVRYPAPELRAISYAVANGKEGTGDLLKKIDPEIIGGEGVIRVNLSTSRLMEAGEAINYLLHYPYGCVEQTTSSTLPWIALRDLRDAVPQLRRTDPEIAKAIQAGADRLLSMQTDSGGLGYWPGASEPEPWACAYGGMGLTLCAQAGAAIPAQSLESLYAYLSADLRGAGDEKDATKLMYRCLSAYTLALAGRAEPAYHETLARRTADLPTIARAFLALAIIESKQEGAADLARAVLADASPDPKGFRYWLAPVRETSARLTPGSGSAIEKRPPP
ncbi:MAG: alpha-2-macroglobulin family protein [Verrucomicrobiales bacterium]